MDLSAKGIVVTGATGIAAAAARRAVLAGAKVFVVSIVEEDCRRLTESLDGSAFAVADLTVEEEAVDAFKRASSHLGRVDGLFAVAGGSGRGMGDGPLHEVLMSGWDSTFALNATSAFLAARESTRAMTSQAPPGGSIVLTSSVLASSPSPELFSTHAYAASKGALDALGLTLASRYARDGVRVNVIAPGLVDTPMAARAASDPKTAAYARDKQPLTDGFLSPSSVAELAVFLLSDSAAAITGQRIAVDGGWSVTEA